MNQFMFQYLNNFVGRSEVLDFVIYFLAHYLPYLLLVGFLFLFFLDKDKQRKIEMMIVALASTFFSRGVITEIIRFFYHSPRPFVVLENVNRLIVHDPTGSFPSGHTVFFFALATAVFFYHKKWGGAFFVGAALIGVTRVISGVHWPLDILGGVVVGIVTTMVVYFLYTKKTRP